MEDLLSYGIPILATGDIGQLPAIAAESHNLLENPDYNLTEIVRQAKDNAILEVATRAREGRPIAFGDYNDGEVLVITAQGNTGSAQQPWWSHHLCHLTYELTVLQP